MTNFNDEATRDFFQIEKFNHVSKKYEGRKSFITKKEARKWLKENARKAGYSFFSLTDWSIEFNPCF